MALTQRTKTVCIVGLSPSSRDRVFKESEDIEMWSLNNGHLCFSEGQLRRFTRWFQIHPRSDYEANHEPELGHAEWLKTCPIPVYMEQVWPDIPTSIRFPRDEIVQKLGYDYFTSSIAYMVTLAIYEGYEEIRLYGIDMASDSEYILERTCLEFWLGYAHAKGIQVVLPEDCPILKGREYGHTMQITTSLINKFLRHYDQGKNNAMAEYNEALGRVNMLEDLLKEKTDDERLTGLLEEKRRLMVQKTGEINLFTGGVRALTDVMIESLRPENEETQRLRSMAGELFDPDHIPMRRDGVVPALR